MARPKIMEDGKITTVMLDRGDLEIIEEVRGKTSVSGYIRSLIKKQVNPIGDEEWTILKRQLEEAKLTIAAFERKEKAVTKEKAEAMAYIAKGLELYKNEDSRRAEDPETCRRWIESRCKGSGISTSEFLSYHHNL